MALNVWVFEDVMEASDRLANDLMMDMRHNADSLFAPRSIVVPHTHFATWLNLRLAQCCGVLANTHMIDLDQALTEALGPDTPSLTLNILRPNDIAPLILATLIDPESRNNVSFTPFFEYIGSLDKPEGIQKGWQLASKLAYLFLEYPYQRPIMVENWIANRCASVEGDEPNSFPELKLNLERLQEAERTIYQALFKKDGLIETHTPSYRTLPEMAKEFEDSLPNARTPLYLFCMPIMSIWHMRIIRTIADHRDVHLYFVVPKCLMSEYEDSPAFRLLTDWGKSQRRAISFYRDSIQFHPSDISHCVQKEGVLSQFHHFLKDMDKENTQKLGQDASLEIWSCPGIMREVESVYEKILDLIANDDTLQLTDMAVLAPDMELYQAPLRIVFSQHPHKIPYNIVDANVARSSLYAQGVESLLDILGGAFPRDKVFSLLRNPCCQAAFGINNETVDQWLEWANALGIYHDLRTTRKTDSDESNESAEPMTWEFALQRLRLGRIMTASNILPEEGVSPHYQYRIPYADIASQDQQSVSKLSEIIALFQQFHMLEETSATEEEESENGNLTESEATKERDKSLSDWAATLRSLFDTFLAIPYDHPIEEIVKQAVETVLDRIISLSPIFTSCHKDLVPFFIPQTLLLEGLAELPARYGRAVTGGVTIASLRRGRLMPFRHIFLLGLGEGQFPGEPDRASIDMRHWVSENAEFDLSLPEFNKGCFLDALLSATEGLHLSYVGLSPEDKKEYNPCSLIYQIMETLNEHILTSPFRIQTVPLTYRSLEYLRQIPAGAMQSLPNRNGDQLLLIAAEILRSKSRFPDALQEDANKWIAEALDQWGDFRKAPEISGDSLSNGVSLTHLYDFLKNPISATVKHILKIHLYEEDRFQWENENEEPFKTNKESLRQYQYELLDKAMHQPDAFHLDEEFQKIHQDRWLRCRTPVNQFKEIDERNSLQQIREDLDQVIAKLINLKAENYLQLVLGEKDNSHPSHCQEIVLPSLFLNEKDTGGMRVYGVVNNILSTEDTVTLVKPVLTGFTKSTLQGFALHPLLCYLALNALDKTEAAWLKGRSFTIKFISPKTDYEVVCKCTSDEALNYLIQLANDTRGPDQKDNLPFEMHSKIKLPANMGYEELDSFLADEILTRLEESGDNRQNDNASSNRSPLPDIIGEVPRMDAYRKVSKRFDLLRNLFLMKSASAASQDLESEI